MPLPAGSGALVRSMRDSRSFHLSTSEGPTQGSPGGLAFVHSHVGDLLHGPRATAFKVGGYWLD